MDNDSKNIQEMTPIPSSRRLFGGFLGVILGLLISLVVVATLSLQSGYNAILLIICLVIIGGVVGWKYYEKTRRSPFAYTYQLSVMLVFLLPLSIIVAISEKLYFNFLIGAALGIILFFLKKQSLIERIKKQGLTKSTLERSENERIEYSKTEKIAIWAAIVGSLVSHFFLEKSASGDSFFVFLSSGISTFFTLVVVILIKLRKAERYLKLSI